MQEKRIVVCIAHPDDEVFCSGALLRLVDAGNELTVVVGTQGEKGSHDPTLTAESIAAARRQEMDMSAQRLGVKEVVQLGYRDGELQYAEDLKETLFRLVRSIRPDVVLTFDPWKRYEIHSDHREIGFAMIEAAHLGANCWYYNGQITDDIKCHRSQELYLFNCDEPNYYVDITDVFERKLYAASAHASQFGPDVDEVRLRSIMNQMNPDVQMTIEPFRKMWHSNLYL
ncbi:MAG: PIG-L deacetylase family protein [Bacilli bacterium]